MGTKSFLIKWFEQAVHSRMNRLTLRHYRQSRARPIYGCETAANCSFATELSLYNARKREHIENAERQLSSIFFAYFIYLFFFACKQEKASPSQLIVDAAYVSLEIQLYKCAYVIQTGTTTYYTVSMNERMRYYVIRERKIAKHISRSIQG